MHILKSDETKTIEGLKCTDEGDNYRLNFHWPEAVKQVYIHKKPGSCDTNAAAIISTTHSDDTPIIKRLQTLQEYRKQAGFTDPKTPGTFTYYIYPFERINGEDFYYTSPDNRHIVTITGQAVINCRVTELKSWRNNKLYDINLSSKHPIPPGTVCCVKKDGSRPACLSDGMAYYFHEPIQCGETFTSHMQVKKNEYICVFISSSAATEYRLEIDSDSHL